MLRDRSASRVLRLLVLALQLALWGAAPVADALLDRESERATIHIESHTQESCPPAHGIDCALCHFLQLHAAPGAAGSPLPVASPLADRAEPFTAAPPQGGWNLSPLPRAPPVLS